MYGTYSFVEIELGHVGLLCRPDDDLTDVLLVTQRVLEGVLSASLLKIEVPLDYHVKLVSINLL